MQKSLRVLNQKKSPYSFLTLTVLRFLAGCMSSSGPGGIGLATVADLFEPKERGRRASLPP